MSTWGIYCTKVSSCRYRVTDAFPTHAPQAAAGVLGALLLHGERVASPELYVLSARYYRRGVIINPTKVIKSLIAARHAA